MSGFGDETLGRKNTTSPLFIHVTHFVLWMWHRVISFCSMS